MDKDPTGLMFADAAVAVAVIAVGIFPVLDSSLPFPFHANAVRGWYEYTRPFYLFFLANIAAWLHFWISVR